MSNTKKVTISLTPEQIQGFIILFILTLILIFFAEITLTLINN